MSEHSVDLIFWKTEMKHGKAQQDVETLIYLDWIQVCSRNSIIIIIL